MHHRLFAGALYAATATIILGTSFAASRLLTEYPFLLSQGVRYAIGAAALGLVVALRRTQVPWPTRNEWLRIVALAATGLVGFNLCLLAALRESDPAAVGVVVGCVPVVLSVLGPLAQRRLPSAQVFVAAGLVSAGAVVVQWGGTSTPAGLGWALGTLAAEAAFSLLAVPLLPRLGPLVVSLYVSLVATAMLLVMVPAIQTTARLSVPTAAEGWAIVYLGVVVTAGAFLAWYAGIARLGVERAGLFAGLVPVAALVSGAVLGQALLSPLRVAGVALVGLGVTYGLGVQPLMVRRKRVPAHQR